MKFIRFLMAIFFSIALAACGGGGGGGGGEAGSPPAPTEPAISSLSTNLATPMKKLTISGARFNTTAALTVSFFNNDGFKLDVPVSEATSTSIIVAVPPYISPSTGKFGEGTVDIRVIQNSAGTIVTSNTISGFKIGSLPTLTLTPGEVTANFAGFLELALTDTENKLLELDTSSGGTINTVDLRAKLESIRLQYGQLKSKIRNAIANPGQAETIGEINGVPVKLDQESLRIADQMMTAMINEILVEMQYRPAQSASLPHGRSILATSAGSSMNLKEYCAVNVCTDSGYPLDYMEMYGSGESVSYSYYKGKILLPEFSERVSKVGQWFADAAGAVGTGLAIVGAGTPTLAAAAITEVIVIGMVAQQGIDAAAYTANPTKENAKQIADDLNNTFTYFSKSVLSPVIGYMSEKAGIIFDLSDYWYPVVEEKIPVFITQVKTFIDRVVPPTCTFFTYSAWSACQPGKTQTRTIISSSPAACTGGDPILSQSCEYGVTGAWSGTINNPNLGSGCEGGTTSISMSLIEAASMSISGTVFGGITLAGNRSSNQITMTEQNTRFGPRGPYPWTWNGSDTITGSVAYFCWSLDTDNLLREGNGTFSVTRY